MTSFRVPRDSPLPTLPSFPAHSTFFIVEFQRERERDFYSCSRNSGTRNVAAA